MASSRSTPLVISSVWAPDCRAAFTMVRISGCPRGSPNPPKNTSGRGSVARTPSRIVSKTAGSIIPSGSFHT